MTRRTLLRLTLGALGGLPDRTLLAQGVSSHTTKPLARPAPSGRPYNSRLVDVASAAGLREPIVYGGVDAKKYIVETIGCGCAFFDYDNDGWMDIFVLAGTRLEGDPKARAIGSTRTTATARSPTSPRKRDSSRWLGLRRLRG